MTESLLTAVLILLLSQCGSLAKCTGSGIIKAKSINIRIVFSTFKTGYYSKHNFVFNLVMKSMTSCGKIFCQFRYLIALFSFFGLVISYMMRVSINVSLLSMVNDTIDSGSGDSHGFYCMNSSYEIKVKKPLFILGEHNWNRVTQGLILGSFYWGYLLTQIPGGMIAYRFGPKWTVVAGIVGCALFELCLPAATYVGPELLIILRVLQGLLQAFVIPSISCLLGLWAPPNEKSRFGSLLSSGTQVGTVFGQVLAGFISHPVLMPNYPLPTYTSHWAYVHYLFGGVALLFAAMWIIMVYDDPQSHPWISWDEKEYLLSTIYHTNTKIYELSEKEKEAMCYTDPDHSRTEYRRPVPFRQIITSIPVMSILLCHFAYNWGWYTLITCMPTYMSRVLGFDLVTNGVLSSIPYVVQIAVTLFVACISDVLITGNIISTKWVRRTNNVIALGGMGAGLLTVGLIGCNQFGAVVLFCITMGLMGASGCGYWTNALDLAPNYAGNIVSITNTFATLPGIFAPILVGYLTRNGSDIQHWMIVFGICAGVAWIVALLNICLTEGEVQPWAQHTTNAAGIESHERVTPTSESYK